MTNFGLFQTDRVCNNNFKLNENGRKFSKRKENTVGKGKIANNEQFLLLLQYSIKRLVLHTHKNLQSLFGKGLTLSQTSPGFYVSAVQVF